MAKLEGVKTLDMVNGEITKVAYGVATYERVEGAAQDGDLLLMRRSGLDTTEGAFYYTHSTAGRYANIIDDKDEPHDWSREHYDLFRKVAASTNPSVEERVTKAEGEIESLKSDVASLKGEAEYKRIAKSEARAGDYVKFDDPPSYLTDKEYYEIKEFDDGDPVIIDDASDEYDTYTDKFEVYRKVSAASVEAEPKPERLKVGDYAKVVEDQSTSNDDPIGYEAAVGDYAEVLIEDKTRIPFKVRLITGQNTGDTAWAREFALVRATDEEVAEAKRVAAEAVERKKWAEIGREVGEYKVGDIFRSPGGNLFEITRIDDSCAFPIIFTNLQGVDDGYKRDAAITLVTPVEVRFDR
ncbi:hypothetical protein [Bacillus spizizenii]|uniref:hypothetical protein n=1 Tax=Bacillus spizizenii TaxID=96241 RepID=UPI002FC67391